MTTGRRHAEARVTAFLDGADNPNIPNAIHSTQGAQEYGYRAALVGGVTVWGWATPSILEVLGDGWLTHGWAEVAFRRPTYPRDEITIRVEEDGSRPGTWQWGMTNQDGATTLTGLVGLGDAPWLGDFATPQRRTPEARPASLPRLTPEVAPVGQDLRPQAVPISVEEMREYALEKQRSDDPRFVGERPLLHPGWIAGRMTRLLHHSYDYGPAIHATSHIQHLARAESGQTIVMAGHFRDAYERKGHQYGVFDGLMLSEDGRELARLRHTTIYQVAKRGDGA